ncbi:MAG: thymidylate synthase [Candidatus Accumulibacter propinquus]
MERLLNDGRQFSASRGKFQEIFGCCLHLKNPRARLSRSEGKGKIFSALGEFLWYMSGDTKLDFIDYYVPGRFQQESDDQVRVRSGYGDRLYSFRGINQIENIIRLLEEKPTTRRAVIQFFDASDLKQNFASIPCTCTLQFLARDKYLHLLVTMRSNDAYIGLPHDVFSFTMLQELIARSVGLELGEYKHCVGSLHLYDDNKYSAVNYLEEGWQSSISMPPMPMENPWDSVNKLREIETSLRTGSAEGHDYGFLDAYWKDLGLLLHAFNLSKKNETLGLVRILRELRCSVYTMFVQSRLDKIEMNSVVEKAGR